jgi:hypothetical protein
MLLDCEESRLSLKTYALPPVLSLGDGLSYRYMVVCANILGSCYGTTGPSSTNPDTGKPYGTAFPQITVR